MSKPTLQEQIDFMNELLEVGKVDIKAITDATDEDLSQEDKARYLEGINEHQEMISAILENLLALRNMQAANERGAGDEPIGEPWQYFPNHQGDYTIVKDKDEPTQIIIGVVESQPEAKRICRSVNRMH